jgi:SPP1 family predicted phage head-tail adaptor
MLQREGKKSLASELRHRVTIQRKTTTTDGEGGVTEAWATLQSVYAAIYPIRADKLSQYNTENVDASHIIKLRGYITILEKDRIVFGNRTFEVLTVENIQEVDMLQIVTCRERRP